MPDTVPNSLLFDASGALQRSVLSDDAFAVLEACTAQLKEVGRSVYLPIDLMVVLVERGASDLADAISRAGRPDGLGGDPLPGLKQLARRVERRHVDPPRLHTSHFSVGFAGILQDALAWARESGRDRLRQSDMARVLRWRVEMQESASVRWALRELVQPVADALFDADGHLRQSLFDSAVWTALLRAVAMSAQSGLPFLGTPHLIAAMTEPRTALLARAAVRAGVEPASLREELVRVVGSRSPAQAEFGLNRRNLTPRLARMLGAAADAADRAGLLVDERAVLAAFTDDGGTSLDILRHHGIVDALNAVVVGELGDDSEHVSLEGSVRPLPEGLPPAATPLLDSLGRDLTAEARAGMLPEILGREAELQRIVNVLMRPEQRNPLLTGEAGVGKTALAVALARRIVEGTVPSRLRSARVVELNGTSLLGGTSYRGELEARIKALLAECSRNVILFIDEAHAVFAPRSSSGQPAEVPNHFKAALASGRLAVVAATTEAEYHRWIEQDPALRRRFERIEIPELTAGQTHAILTTLAPTLESDYEVPIDPDAIQAAIELAVRHIPEQSLPDKAKKLLIDATIAVSASVAMTPVEPDSDGGSGAMALRRRSVTRDDVAAQVSLKTAVPLDRVAGGARGWWSGLEGRLVERCPAQPHAARTVARALVEGRVARVGSRRPQGVLVFVGAPGVGRAALAEAIALEVFGTRTALLQLDMADFGESHSIARLIGSPPGYVGYQDEDALVTPLRRRPARVVLLKDFDLAHPRVQDRFARLFGDGEITDTRGLRADAGHAIFVLTLTRAVIDRNRIGFGGAESAAHAVELRALSPDLAERLRGVSLSVVPFRNATDEGGALGRRLMVARLEAFVQSIGDEFRIALHISPDLRDDLVDRAARLSDARAVEDVFAETIVARVTRALLDGVDGDTLCLDDTHATPLAGKAVVREPEQA